MLRSMLAKHCKEFGPQWDVHLQQLLFAYRTKPHESTRESPFYLLYGCDAQLPTATVLDMPPPPYTLDLDDYKVELTRGLASAWKVARLERSARHRFGRKEAMTGRPHPETTKKEAEYWSLCQQKPLVKTGNYHSILRAALDSVSGY